MSGVNAMHHDNLGSDNLSLGSSFRVDPHASSLSAGSSTFPDNKNRQSATSATEHIARLESKAVWCMRLVVALVMLTSTIGVALLVKNYLESDQQEHFQETFDDCAEKVVNSFTSHLHHTLEALDTFSVSTIATANVSNQIWPRVTVPGFALQAAKLRNLANAISVTQYHAVDSSVRDDWEQYSFDNSDWVQDSSQLMKTDDTFKGSLGDDFTRKPFIFENDGKAVPRNDIGPLFPQWQSYPSVANFPPFNWDAREYEIFRSSLPILLRTQKPVIGPIANLPMNGTNPSAETMETVSRLSDYSSRSTNRREPLSDLYFPLRSGAADIPTNTDTSSTTNDSKVVAVVGLTFFWKDISKMFLSEEAEAVVVVFGNSCGQEFTYEIVGSTSTYLGNGDHHNVQFNDMVRHENIQDLVNQSQFHPSVLLADEGCRYWLRIYPSPALHRRIISDNPTIFAVFAAMIFVFTAGVFLVYDAWVERRQRIVMQSALKSAAIVSSLFPSNVRDRMFTPPPTEGAARGLTAALMRRQSQSSDQHQSPDSPIADLFPACTVMMCDISGFTAWSSARQPSQVFMLLEAIYSAFDDIARRRGVFKVETIGDSYVAVAGLPEPRMDHAVVMVKFAHDCRNAMNQTTYRLEALLGPETGDLTMRFGLNSGAVTAGVLRGERSRFQLFGDTVNMASRMESTGRANLIQASQSTCDELVATGKAHWCNERSDLVEVKGVKGAVKTYWVNPSAKGTASTSTGSVRNYEEYDDTSPETAKLLRLVEWNVSILNQSICSIISHRAALDVQSETADTREVIRSDPTLHLSSRRLCDEISEVIVLPKKASIVHGGSSAELEEDVMEQLIRFVSSIAATYKDNPFHNFEHASHVCMSVTKLLSRIGPSASVNSDSTNKDDHTYGITTDPLTHFGCVFAALVHDVDHQGVPNTQLIKEGAHVATFYHGKSVAEQNSVRIGWELFMCEEFDKLRQVVAPTAHDVRRLRQLVVNSVMATDIMDKELIKLRNERWHKAFSMEAVNQKATIVVEHLMQASDVSHTMQHWHIYRKWNERLYEEQLLAFKAGRAEVDPTEGWYEGELGFLNFYVIPLAKKLADCGVFGVSSHECLDYATKNRDEWMLRGRETVAEMKERISQGEGMSSTHPDT